MSEQAHEEVELPFDEDAPLKPAHGEFVDEPNEEEDDDGVA